MPESTEARAQPFPTTHWTVVSEASAADPGVRTRSLEHLAELYWRPIYAYIRRKWGKSDADARDLTQEFFVSLFERDYLGGLGPERGRFRSYVRATLDNLVREDRRDARRLKRGGETPHFSLRMNEEVDLPAADSPEQALRREWAQAILTDAVDRLKSELCGAGKKNVFEVLLHKEIDPAPGAEPSYEELASRFGVSVTDVRNMLYRAKERLGELVLACVRESVMREIDAREEMRELFEDLAT